MKFGKQDLRARFPFWLSVLFAGTAGTAIADESAQGFMDGATLDVLSRNFYLNSEEQSPSPGDKRSKKEWAQGFISAFESGFTPGTLGFGLDAHAFVGLKLDGGKGHSGTGLLPVDDDGRSEDNYSSGGGALKIRASQTTLAFGEMMVETPVFDTADKRLQPRFEHLRDSRPELHDALRHGQPNRRHPCAQGRRLQPFR